MDDTLNRLKTNIQLWVALKDASPRDLYIMTLAMTMTNALIESKCQYHFRVHVVLYHKEPKPMLKMVYKETN